MTREEAINLIKQVLPCLNIDEKIREGFETLIPELKESEDERIRKALIEFLRESYSRGNAPEECAKWIVWLEQPKEQKLRTFNEPYNPDDHEVFIEGNATSLKHKEQKPAEWDELQADFRNINEAFEDGKKEVVAHPEKYGLCKLAEWSEEDDATIKSAVHWLEKYLSTIRAKDVSSATQDGILTVKTTITNLKSLPSS